MHVRCLELVLVTGLLGLLAALSNAFPSLPSHSLDAWVLQQQNRSLNYLIQNIAPNGSVPGCIVASTSTSNPPYFYYWVRDGALVMRALLPYYREHPEVWEPIFWDFLKFNRALQWTPNRSVSPWDPMGLGEPKFHPDGSAFQDDWGRPQFDGPALRALVAMEFVTEYLKRGGRIEAVLQWVYRAEFPANTLTKLDLELTGIVHDLPCFDLWEEVLGIHFYTLRVQLEALNQGALFALMLNDTGASVWYKSQANLVRTHLEQWFWNGEVYVPTVQYVRGVQKPANLDVSILLAALHTFSLSQFLQDAFLATVGRFALAFSKFVINRPGSALGAALGRYPEDTYMGGQAWYLATLAMSEVYYKISLALLAVPSITITATSAPFFPATMPLGPHPVSLALVRSFKNIGDRYLARVRAHTPSSGHLSEQFHGDTGCPCSAENLTWSYAAFLTTSRTRAHLVQILEKAAQQKSEAQRTAHTWHGDDAPQLLLQHA